ncbi:MAG: sigma-54-dependent Fis family transcriptional regulator [Calditrichaceae bacterium]|nr:sigma-54-dependent Fis family transcriptional regulator [Calditrichaceae bacterium]MBN2708878.1 sigma-54-dependent Fis family transcriptional regulator [Calditrichaceae bacterium]RQV97596.1 MAG: sigma-54-dependent Fis family transcriptional regulator [Calditrichota bacterium]
MESNPPAVLIVDDEPNILKTMKICLEDAGYTTFAFQNPIEAIDAVRRQKFDLAFVDLKMAPIDGMQALQSIKEISPGTTVVIITAHGSIESAVKAVKSGAYDYIQKPFDYMQLQLIAGRALDYHNLKQEIKRLQSGVIGQKFITKNRQMRETIDLAVRAASSDISVLIEGESGTGKELIADMIYDNSARCNGPYLKINCAAIPDNLLESELFGHVKGAFTGATKDRKGKFEEADGGTIFLDEIAELSPALQAKLLRVLQNNEITRLGENKSRLINVRIIAATNRNLEAAIAEGTFRDDVYYRLNAMRIKLLPLRERPEDLLPLISFFMKKYHPDPAAEITSDALYVLRNYRWPGNVRELENFIRRAALLSAEQNIDVKHLPEELQAPAHSAGDVLSLEEMEKSHIARVLNLSKDLQEAAQLLGIDPATLWRKRKRYNL